ALVAVVAARIGRRRAVARTWLVGPWGNVARLQRSVAAPLVVRLLRRTVVLAETEEAADELVAAGVALGSIKEIAHGVDVDHWRVPTAAERDTARRRLGGAGAAGGVAGCGGVDLR